MSTRDVLDHHLQAFSAGDAEEIAKDYDDQSVMITPNGQVVGQAAIKAAVADTFSGLFEPGTYTFVMDRVEVAGDVAFIAWHADTASQAIPLGTDTFVVRDGKIAVQTFAAQVNPR